MTLVFSGLSGGVPNFDLLQGPRQRLEDLRWQWPRENPGATPIVLVDIDEASLGRVGTWPWPRETTAKLVSNLLDVYQVNVVGLDLLFPDPSYRTQSDQGLVKLARRGVVFAQSLGLEGSTTRTEKGVLSNALPCPAGYSWPEATGYVGLMPGLNGAQSGHLTPNFAPDGLIREYFPLIRYRNACYPALALAVYGQLTNSNLAALTVREPTGKGHDYTSLQDPISGLSMPLNGDGAALIPWHQEGWPRIPAKEVLERTADPTLLAHSIVLVGSTATGLGDLVPTPLTSKFPGVQIHAEVLASLIDQGWTYRPQWAWPSAALATWLFSFGLLVLGRSRRPLALTFAGIAGVLIWSGLNLLAWHRHLDIPWVPLLWVAGLQLPGQLLVSSLHARFREQRIYQQFSLYLPKDVLDALVESGSDPRQLEAERREITVLFADIRGFTSLSEPLQPEQVVYVLHLVMSRFAEIIGAYRGTLDKFIGDEVMAFWGAPLPIADHADLALDCAEAMLAALPEINKTLAKEGLPSIRIGIGINSGYAAVGNMGSHQRRAYTAVGDTVNLASRLEALTRELNEPVLLGEATCRLLSRHMLAAVDHFKMRGREHTILVAKPCFNLSAAPATAPEPDSPVQGKLW